MARGSRVTKVVLLTVVSGSLSACFFARSKGDRLAQEAEERDRRVAALEQEQRQERDELTDELTKAKQQVAELQKILEQATAVVTRNSADLGLEVQQLREQLGALEGQIAEIRNQSDQTGSELARMRDDVNKRLDVLARKAGIDMALPESEIPRDREEHFQAGYRAYQGNEQSRSRALFREYLARYRTDDKADDAQYWIGMSYLQEDRPATALGELRKVITEWPHGDMVDDALLAMGDAFYRLHACTDARTALEALIQGHSTSPLVRDARNKLRIIARAPRGYCTS